MQTPVLIIGGGLSGLVTAWKLSKIGVDFKLIEARGRFGGRVLSANSMDNTSTDSSTVDLGPAWFWPGQQNMKQLINELELDSSVFLQPCKGMSVMEYQNGKIERGMGSAAMADSYRLERGIDSLIRQLVNRITATNLLHSTVATGLSKTSKGISTTVEIDSNTQTIESQHVVLALPPRLIESSLIFTPELPDKLNKQMSSVATWMAGQAKFAAVYSQAFWRDTGMSGDGFSQRGPLVEIHDASPEKDGPYALFGFVGIPAQHRQGQSAAIKSAAVEQLARMFGAAANEPLEIHLQDWAFDSFTATEADRNPHGAHSNMSALPQTQWDNRIVFSGTETAERHGHSNGYLEGAVESGIRASTILSRHLSV